MENEIVETTATPILVYPAPPAVESPWFDFIQGIVGSVVWPAVVVLAIILFHRQLLDMIPSIDGVKVAGAEVTFKNRVEAVVEQAKEIDPPDVEVAEENNARLGYLVNMSTSSPTGAIISAWKDLESASLDLVKFVHELGKADRAAETHSRLTQNLRALEKSPSRSGLGQFMIRYSILPQTEVETFEELRKLRNRAMHEAEGTITVDEAISYVRVADRLTDVIRTTARNIGMPEQEYMPLV